VKQATIRFYWSRSASGDVTAQRLEVTKDGVKSVFDLPAELEEFVTEVNAKASVLFRVTAIDGDGNEGPSDTFDFTLSDLTAPLPLTNLGFEVLAINDLPDEPTAPPA